MLLFIRATFCIVSLCWYAFCLLVVLVKLSVLAEWLARKTPLWKPNRGEGIISAKPRPNSERDFLGLICCFIVLLYVCLVPGPRWFSIFPISMARYSMFVLKVPLNTNQLTSYAVCVLVILASSAPPAPCGLRGCKNWPAPFPGRMSYKVTKPGLALSVVS